MDIIKKLFKDLSDKEKFEIVIIVSLLFFCTIVVLSAIAWSRGQDVDYFKEKIVIMEERLNHNDKRDHDQGERINNVEARVAEAEKDITVTVINVAATQNVVKDIINPPNKRPQTIPPFDKLPPLPAPRKTVTESIKPISPEQAKRMTIDIPKNIQ